MLGVFTFTLFCSASLLFLIEPMAGKMMLPLLGGTPAVWNTCMVFFQAILLAGYGYAHWASTALGARKQARLHLAILAIPILSVAVNGLLFGGMLSPNEKLILGHEGNPIPALLLVLTLCIGVPMFVVCTSAPLLQRWFASTDHPMAKDPYFLYGASNFGSMLALVGYPALVEPNLTLKNQQIIWVVGYCTLALLTAGCALLMWKSNPAPEPSASPPAPSPKTDNPGHSIETVTKSSTVPSAAIKGVSRDITRLPGTHAAKLPAEPPADGPQLDRPVNWTRRLHWVALAMVPSSLMLGATTYMTTDIASIPLLWILPLALYLLSFIIVFAHISPRTQSIVTTIFLVVLAGGLAWSIANHFFPDQSGDSDKNETMRWVLYLIGAGLAAFSLKILRVRDSALIHRVMIMIMPLLVLLIIFMMLSGIRPSSIVTTIALHLAVLFSVSMVCHGELAHDRPAAKDLTEYFLWMSFGGVVGGLFNGLFAPIAFRGIVEYELIMMVACLLLPPLGLSKDSVWARRADVALAIIFLSVGGFLLISRSLDGVAGNTGWLASVPAMAIGVSAFVVGVILALGALYHHVHYQPVSQGTLHKMGKLLAEEAAAPAFRSTVSVKKKPIENYWLNLSQSGLHRVQNVYDRVNKRFSNQVRIPVAVTAIGAGIFLLLMYSLDKLPDMQSLTAGLWQWLVTALLLGGVLGGIATYRGWGSPPAEPGEPPQNHWLDRVLDVVLPFSLMVLVVGLFWGLQSKAIQGRLLAFADKLNMDSDDFTNILRFGLPAVLCYTFVERSVRFGLGVGALLLAAGYSNVIAESPLFQDRSFFGVLTIEDRRPSYLYEIRDPDGRSHFCTTQSERYRLMSTSWAKLTDDSLKSLKTNVPEKVYKKLTDLKDQALETSDFIKELKKRLTREEQDSFQGQVLNDVESPRPKLVGFWGYATHSLTHGTTLHGKQLVEPGVNEVPTTYYHRTGPIGHITRAFNNDPSRPLAVIGLGTGSMACYALKGQTIDFFDIDPIVVGISFDSNEYFSFVEDAETRGANISLILGDARLTIKPDADKVRLKPLHKRQGAKTPARTFGEPLSPDQKYGIIVVDAFSSDAIPIHLITRQALEIFRDRLLPDGVLCMHISNRYLSLQPVLANIVEDLGMAGMHMSDDDESGVAKTRSHWVAIARKREHLEKLLHPVRWMNDNDQLLLLGPALFPAQATTGLAATTGLCHAFARVVDIHQAEEEKRTHEPTIRRSWMPVSTQERFADRLENARATVAKLEAKAKDAQDEKVRTDAEKDLTGARNKVQNLEKTMTLYKRVGVWSDDFSNLIRVWRLKEDYDTDD
jgi:hypothetical protein